MRATPTAALALCAAACALALFAGTAYAVPIARDRTHHHRLQQRVQRQHRTAAAAAGASDADAAAAADAQWYPMFPDVVGPNNEHRRAALHLDLPHDLLPVVYGTTPTRTLTRQEVTARNGVSVGAAVYVHEAFHDVDRPVGTDPDTGAPVLHTAVPGPGLTAANVLQFLQNHALNGPATTVALHTWFDALSGEGVVQAPYFRAYDDGGANVAPRSTALFNALWNMFGSPESHWGVAVARYRVVGRRDYKYDVYWIGGVDNTERGQNALHTEYQLLAALKDFEDQLLLSGALVDVELGAPILSNKVTERQTNWVLLFPPCANGNRACGSHIAHFDGQHPNWANERQPALARRDSQCPAARAGTAGSHVVWFKDPATEGNAVEQPH